jgi:hypothetical protein
MAAELLFARVALVTVLTTVHHAPYGDIVAGLMLLDRLSRGGYPPNDLVARNQRIAASAPIVPYRMEIRVADAGVEDLDRDIVVSQVSQVSPLSRAKFTFQ